MLYNANNVTASFINIDSLEHFQINGKDVVQND